MVKTSLLMPLPRGDSRRRRRRPQPPEPRILAAPPEVLSPRMVGLIEGLAEDWRRLDERIDHRFASTPVEMMHRGEW